jgi:hypothetical membrane protein
MADMDSTSPGSGHELTRALLACGPAGAALFVAVFLIDGATRAAYDPTYHPVSALSLGDRGWVQIANFVASGLLLTAFAVGLRRVVRAGRASVWGPLLLGVFGLSLVLSGVFVMDPIRGYPPGTAPDATGGSWQHAVHDGAGIVVFLSLPVACFVVARRFAARPRPGWVRYCLATGLAGLALFVWFGVAWEADHPQAGLIQRILIIVDLTWVAALGLWLMFARSPRRLAAGIS